MNILVTGANGFLGSHLVVELLRAGHSVTTITRTTLNYTHPSLKSIICDLKAISENTVSSSFDVLYHIAAVINFDISQESIDQLTENNILVIDSIVRLVKNNKIKKIVLASSCSVYEENFIKGIKIKESANLRPNNLYAISKLCAEWILLSKLKNSLTFVYIIRFSSIYGLGQNNQSILPIFISKAIKGDPILIFGSGNRTQDYVNIADAVAANVNCLHANLPNGTILNIGSGKGTSDLELATNIKFIWKSKSDIIILNQQTKPEPIFTFDIEKAKNLINYHPMELIKGLKEYAKKQKTFLNEASNNK